MSMQGIAPIYIERNSSIGYSPRVVATAPEAIDVPFDGMTLLFGRNGAGKTTLLKTMARLIPSLSGNSTPNAGVVFMSEDVDAPRNFALVDVLRGKQGERIHGSDYLGLAEDLGLDIAKKYFSLSKGNKQKFRIVWSEFMAKTWGKPYLLLDEPMSGLDFECRQILWRHWEATAKAFGRVISIHPQELPLRPKMIIKVEDGGIIAPSIDTEMAHLKTLLSVKP